MILSRCRDQDRLYAQGRRGGPPGDIVTNARGGQSNHNFGVAFDIDISRDGWRTTLRDGPEFDRAGALGTALGLEWGGNWRTIQDRPHFQFTGGQTTRQLRQRFESGQPVLP
jgi:peptidoglycan LD-endopeptidase CwlK